MALAAIGELMRDHDSDPVGAAQRLRRISHADLSAEDLPGYTWLVNHLIGEESHQWSEALRMHRQTLGIAAHPPVALRNRAVAAQLAGAPLEAWQAEDALAETTGATQSQASVTTRVAVLQHLAASDRATVIAAALEPCVRAIAQWPSPGPLASMLAASLNNVVSAWLDHPNPETDVPRVAKVMRESARACKDIWQVAGTWLNHERADYLIALVSNRLGDWPAARDAAQQGLNTIAANGTEDVDRAFLLVELARACRGLQQRDEHERAREQAFALAEMFDDPGLREWFDRKAASV